MKDKERIIEVLNKYYNPEQMKRDQYNWNDYFPAIAEELSRSEPDNTRGNEKKAECKIVNEHCVQYKGNLYYQSYDSPNPETTQAQPQTAVMPTDEEIIKKVQKLRYKRLHGKGHMSITRMTLGELEWFDLIQELYKYILSQVKVVDLREELIKFADWVVSGKGNDNAENAIDFVDEYLASKTKNE